MRFLIALLTITTVIASSTPAYGCCLTDWLHGRNANPYAVGYAPYAAGYAPVAAPYAMGYAPTGLPYAANYPPVASSPVPIQHVPIQPVATTSVLRPTWTNTAPVLSSGVYQAQRPGYYANQPVYNNPSVYTGMPVTGAYSAARIPVAPSYRGSAPASSYFGATNQYPNTFASGYSPRSYSSGTAPIGLPTTILPATNVAPVFAPTPPRRRGGLSRFFGSWFGTNYRSSYYRAPVTYYRPATTVDPISGTTVTVQQPCTSYVQQLQRTPYSSLQGPGATQLQPTPPCSTPGCGNSYSAAPLSGAYPAPNSYASPIPSGVGQVGATMPLTGPPSGAAIRPPSSGDDFTPLQQPEIRNRPPSTESRSRSEQQDSDRMQPKSYWELQDGDDSTAMIRHLQTNGSPAQPIHAPEDYVSPFGRETQSSAKPVKHNTLETPQLPARSYKSVEKPQDSNWVSAPIREASSSTRRAYRPAPRPTSRSTASPIKRDTTWKPARK